MNDLLIWKGVTISTSLTKNKENKWGIYDKALETCTEMATHISFTDADKTFIS